MSRQNNFFKNINGDASFCGIPNAKLIDLNQGVRNGVTVIVVTLTTPDGVTAREYVGRNAVVIEGKINIDGIPITSRSDSRLIVIDGVSIVTGHLFV